MRCVLGAAKLHNDHGAAPPAGRVWECRRRERWVAANKPCGGQRASSSVWRAWRFGFGRMHAPGSGLAVRARGREAARHGRDGIVPAECRLQQVGVVMVHDFSGLFTVQ